jgi:hypothetical protein
MTQLNLFTPELLEQITNHPVKPQSDILAHLKLLAQMGMYRDLIAVLLELTGIPLPLLRYYAGPLVLHKTPWSESIPDWLKTACLSDRLDLIVEEYSNRIVGNYCTSTEVVAYMMGATFEAPLHHSYYNVYMWAARDTLTRHDRLPKGYNLSELAEFSTVKFDSIQNDYHHLARAIRKSVVRHAASQGWGKRKLSQDKSADADLPTENVTAKSQKDRSTVGEQLSLF